MSLIDDRDQDHDDTARDAHLRAALRHAPDAQAAPPAALSAAILREAQQAVAAPAHSTAADEAPGARLWRTVAALWAALARPPVAAGFASVLVASVVGVMWWDRPLDTTGAPVAADAPVQPAAAPPASNPLPQPAPAAAARAEPAAKATPGESAALPPATRAAAPPNAAVEAPRHAEAAPTRATEARPTEPPAAAAPPAVAPPAARSAAAVAADTMASKLAQGQSDTGWFDPTPPPASLPELTARIAAGAPRWTWQRGSAAAQPMNDAMLAWLSMAARDAGPAGGATTEAASADAAELRLLRDGRWLHTLRIDASTLRWRSLGPPALERALPLAPQAAAALRAALDAAAPP